MFGKTEFSTHAMQLSQINVFNFRPNTHTCSHWRHAVTGDDHAIRHANKHVPNYSGNGTTANAAKRNDARVARRTLEHCLCGYRSHRLTQICIAVWPPLQLVGVRSESRAGRLLLGLRSVHDTAGHSHRSLRIGPPEHWRCLAVAGAAHHCDAPGGRTFVVADAVPALRDGRFLGESAGRV